MNTPRRSLALTTAAVAAAAMLSLSACANPIEALTESAVEGLVEQGTGGKVDIDTGGDGSMTIETDEGGKVEIGGSSSVPDTWPGLPLPNGKLAASVTTDEGILLSYETTEAEAEKLVQALEQQGFTTEQTMDLGEMKGAMMRKGDDGASVNWIMEDDGQVMLQYMALFTK